MSAVDRRGLVEGSRVRVGGHFGGLVKSGVVAATWDGVSRYVDVLLDGKVKPKPYPVGRVRLEERPPPAVGELVARPEVTGAAARPVPRAKPPVRSRQYLAWLRSLPCSYCRSTKQVEAHHWAPTKAMARKPSDLDALPLCEDCHRRFHDTGALAPMDPRTTREAFLRAQVRCLQAWILRGRAS